MEVSQGVITDEVVVSAVSAVNADSDLTATDLQLAHAVVNSLAVSSTVGVGHAFTTSAHSRGEAFVFNAPGAPSRYDSFPVRQLVPSPQGVYAVVGGDVRVMQRGDVSAYIVYDSVEFSLMRIRPRKIEVDTSQDVSVRVDVADASGWYTYHGNRVVQLGRGLRSSRLNITITMTGSEFTYYGAFVYGTGTNRMAR